MTKKAIITGITGQDGSYLAELLIIKGYEVYGIIRPSTRTYFGNIKDVKDKIHLVEGDITDFASILRIIQTIVPHEVYNLAAQSHVGKSFKEPILTANVDAIGVLNLLEAIRQINVGIRFYQASTSELFGKSPAPQNEQTAFQPRSPYGVAKLYGHWITINYRESYGMFACTGILFNHESPRRGEEFVTRKITKAIANIKAGKQSKLELGNLESKRDWGFAGDYVEGMWRMLQAEQADDYILATNETHTVREFCEIAFNKVGLNYEDYVVINPNFYRPAEVDVLQGDYTKAERKLGWIPKHTFRDLVELMVETDLKQVKELM